MTLPISILGAGVLLAAACLSLGLQCWRLRRRIEKLSAASAVQREDASAIAENLTLRQDQTAETVTVLTNRIHQLAQQVEELTRTPRLESAPHLNLATRVRVMRLASRGENASHISSVLAIPLAEVELILKLHPLTLA